MLQVPRTGAAVVLAAIVTVAPTMNTAPTWRTLSHPAIVPAASSACASTGMPTAYTGTWRGLSAQGEINLHQRTKNGGGMVEEDIGHDVSKFTFTVDTHGHVTKGGGKALYHFNVKAYSVAFPNQVSARAYLDGGVQPRTFKIGGQVCAKGTMQIESTNTADLLLFDGSKDTKIGAWNIFPSEEARITEEKKRLYVRDITLVKKIWMHMSWQATKCITFALHEHRTWTGNTAMLEKDIGVYYDVPVTFTYIITDTNPEVTFKPGEPYVHNMEAAVASRLGTLAKLVEEEWPDAGPGGQPVKVRVTAAWAPVGTHGPNSRHYSGRALDLTTDPVDPSKYGCLAGLAYEAGFDWVFYEKPDHVHASLAYLAS